MNGVDRRWQLEWSPTCDDGTLALRSAGLILGIAPYRGPILRPCSAAAIALQPFVFAGIGVPAECDASVRSMQGCRVARSFPPPRRHGEPIAAAYERIRVSCLPLNSSRRSIRLDPLSQGILPPPPARTGKHPAGQAGQRHMARRGRVCGH